MQSDPEHGSGSWEHAVVRQSCLVMFPARRAMFPAQFAQRLSRVITDGWGYDMPLFCRKYRCNLTRNMAVAAGNMQLYGSHVPSPHSHVLNHCFAAKKRSIWPGTRQRQPGTRTCTAIMFPTRTALFPAQSKHRLTRVIITDG